MAGIRKHGAHRYSLSTAATAAGTAANPATWPYDAFAAQGAGTTANPVTGFDQTVEQVTEMSLILGTALTGQATNFTTFRVTHRNSAGTTQNQLTIVASTTAFVFNAFQPVSLAVANGVAIPNQGTNGTGTLTVASGTALPWSLAAGDNITLDTTVGGTGQYTGGISLGITVQQKGA